MITNPIEREVLKLIVDDHFGLWEILSVVEASALEEVGPDRVRQDAASVVAALVNRGWADLYRYEEADARPIRMSPTEARDVLPHAWSWRAPMPGSPQIRIGATKSGAEAFYASDTGQPKNRE